MDTFVCKVSLTKSLESLCILVTQIAILLLNIIIIIDVCKIIRRRVLVVNGIFGAFNMNLLISLDSATQTV